MRPLSLALVLPTMLGLFACSAPERSDRPIVATTVAPTGWLLAQLVGEEAEVVVLVGPGDNPHTWMPSDATAAKLGQARLFARVGIPLERGPWFQSVLGAGFPVVDLEPAAPTFDHHQELDHDHHHGDPHPWNDPQALIRHAELAAPALADVFPASRQAIDQRRAQLVQVLEALDLALAETLAPCAGRPFLVHHPAWESLASRYGLVQLAVEVEGKDPLDAELVRLRELVAEAGLTVLFVQPQIKQAAARAVAEAFDLEVVELDPLAADPLVALPHAATAIAAACGEPG